MDLTKLSESVQSQIRSDMMMYNICRCITELVENSIDAGASCIAVKMNLTIFQIQVVDNGRGVRKEDLNYIGTRYWSTKCYHTSNSKKYSTSHDHRGEFLASIKNSCSRLMIVSRAVEDNTTYCKIFDASKTGTVVEALHQRASKGTTIIISNFFGNLPVRQKRIVPAVEIQNTKRCIEAISLLHPSILFVLKDDAKNVEILRIPRTSSTLRTFHFLFPHIIEQRSSMIKVVAHESNISVRAMICRQVHVNRDFQFVFLNKRYMVKSDIRTLVNELLSKKGLFEAVSKNTDIVSRQQHQQRQKSTVKVAKNAIFILNICCPPDEYRITFLPDKRQVDFKDKTKVKRCLMKLVDSFWERGLFESDSVPLNTVLALPVKKTKCNFMPRLLFEKMNRIRTICGVPAYREPAAEVKKPNPKDSNGLEIDCAISEAQDHRNGSPRRTTLEPRKTTDSRPLILKEHREFEEMDLHPKNKKALAAGRELTDRQLAPVTNPRTPVCQRPLENPILSTVRLLNCHYRLPKANIASEKLVLSVLNTSKIHEKLLSISAKAGKMEASGRISSFTRKSTNNEKCVPSCCIQTNSNIRLYEAKRKFHLRKTKAFSRACKLKGLCKSRPKGTKKRQSNVNCPERRKLEHESKKIFVLRESLLNVDDNLYYPKIPSSKLTLNSKLSLPQSRNYSEEIAVFNLRNPSQKCPDQPTRVQMNSARRTRISETTLTFGKEYNDGVLNENKNLGRNKAIQSFGLNPHSEAPFKINRSEPRNCVPEVADFIYAPSLKKASDNCVIMEKNAFETLQSEIRFTSHPETLGSPEIFTSKNEVSQSLWRRNHFSEKVLDREIRDRTSRFDSNGREWLYDVRFNWFPTVNLQTKSKNENSCVIPRCICNCHKMAMLSESLATLQEPLVLTNALENPANANKLPALLPSQLSSSLIKSSTEARIFEHDSPNHHSGMPPSSTNTCDVICESNTKSKAHSLGIFSELAEFYSKTKKVEASQSLFTSSVNQLLKESIKGVQNEKEISSVFSKSCDETLRNEQPIFNQATCDSYSRLTESMNRCSVKNNPVEVSQNRFNMFECSTRNDLCTTSTPKRCFPKLDERISDILSPSEERPYNVRQMANDSFGMSEEDHLLIGNTSAPGDFVHLADDSFLTNRGDVSSSTPRDNSLFQLANDSFCKNLECCWVGHTPGARYLKKFTNNLLCTDIENSKISNAVEPNDTTQFSNSLCFMSTGVETSKIDNTFGSSDPTQVASSSDCVDLRNSEVGNTFGSNDPTQLAKSSFKSIYPKNSKMSSTFGSSDSTQMENDLLFIDPKNSSASNTVALNNSDLLADSLCKSVGLRNFKNNNALGADGTIRMTDNLDSLDVENSKIDNTAEANVPTNVANDVFCTDLENCSIVNAMLCTNTTESDRLEVNERFYRDNDSFVEKTLYRKKLKFFDSTSILDIPQGILDVQGTKSKPASFEKSQNIDFHKFTKPCSMKNHLTIDDYGNSCLRIFPLMKEIINSKEDDFNLDYGNFPEDLNCALVFSKKDLKSVQFLAQLNNKFLLGSVTMEGTRDQIIVMFDQHAVDERIRVERLSREYTHENGVWKSIAIRDSICISVSRCEISVMIDFRDYFCNRGIDFEFDEFGEDLEDEFSIRVIRVPLCLHNRALREPSKTNVVACLKQLTESLIKELTHTLIRTHGISRSATPQTLQNIINSEACRGAVKFGEQLSADVCSTLLQSLWSCNMPFQCAHGRPLLAPLVNVAKLAHIGKRKLLKQTLDELRIQLL